MKKQSSLNAILISAIVTVVVVVVTGTETGPVMVTMGTGGGGGGTSRKELANMANAKIMSVSFRLTMLR
jgi:hypothetical protein